MPNIYSIYGVQIDTGAATTDLGQITASRISPALQQAVEGGDGKVDADYAAVLSQRPMIEFTTRQIAGLLGVIGPDGFGFNDAADSKNMTFWLRQRAHGGQFSAGGAHIKFSVLKGLAVLTGIRAGQDGLAEAGVAVYAVSADGTAAPIARAFGQALAGSPAATQLFTSGPVWINGAAVDGFQDVSVDFGISVSPVAGDGHVFPVHASIVRRRPTITGRTLHADVLDTLGLSGVARSGTLRAFLRRKAAGGVNEADNSGVHVRFDVAAGRIHSEEWAGSDGDHAGVRVVITPTKTGGTDVIAIVTNAEINGT